MLEYGVPGSGECAKLNHKPSPVFFFKKWVVETITKLGQPWLDDYSDTFIGCYQGSNQHYKKKRSFDIRLIIVN